MMNAIACKEPDVFERLRMEKPAPKKGEVLVKTLAVGVCGTDYHAFRGRQPYFTYPRILGHEIAGVIAEIGCCAPESLKVGDEVTILPYLHCRTCIACRNGKPNACSRLQVLGVHVDGAMREYFTVPAEFVVKTGGLRLNQCVIVEPLCIGLHAVNRGRVKQGETVMIVGAGPIGLAAMKFAKLAGAVVIAMDTNAERLAFCQEWAKADYAINANCGVRERLDELTGGDGPSVVIDATGNAVSMKNTFDYAGHGGRIVYVSLVHDDISFSDPAFHKKELTLLGSRGATMQEFDHAIECLKDGRIDADAYVTHRAPFSDAATAFTGWIQPGSGVIKAVIEF